MSFRNGVADKEVKGRTRASSQRAASASRTPSNTDEDNTGDSTSSLQGKGKAPKTKSRLKTPFVSSTPVKPIVMSDKVSPVLEGLKQLIVHEGDMGPLTQHSISSLGTTVLNTQLPTPIQEAIDSVHEELNSTKNSLKVLSLNAKHLILDPHEFVSSINKCVDDITGLSTAISQQFDKVTAMLETNINKLTVTEELYNKILALDKKCEDKAAEEEMLLTKIADLTSKLDEFRIVETSETLAKSFQQATDLTTRLEKLNESCNATSVETSKITNNAQKILKQLENHPVSMGHPISMGHPVGPQTHHCLTENSPRPAPSPSSSSKALELIASSPLLKDPANKKFEPVLEYIEDFAPHLLEDLVALCDTLEWTAEGGHKVAAQGAPYQYWNHVLNGKSKLDLLDALINALIDLIKKAFPDAPLPNSALYNEYNGPEAYLADHEDNEKCLDPDSNIYTFTMEDIMEILFTSSVEDGKTFKLSPKHGSLYVMSVASQALWRHQIKKCVNFLGRRRVITLRTVAERFRKSTIVLGDSNTKYINFENDTSTRGRNFGYAIPGVRVSAPKVDQIDPLACAGYSNVLIHCGLNDLKGNRPNPRKVFDDLICTAEAVRIICPRARICVSPILPSKIPMFNETAKAFNNLLFEHINSRNKPSITSLDFNCFVDERGLLCKDLTRYMSPDPFHLGREGYRLLANIFRGLILGSKVDGRSYARVSNPSSRRLSNSIINYRDSGSQRIPGGRRSHPVTSSHGHPHSSEYDYS